MSRITQCIELLQSQGRKALIPYITAGDPVPELTVPLAHALVQAGADIIELGVPFSDPMADGPVIQRASERALEHHVSLRQVLAMVREFRQTDTKTPIVLMGYLNPVEVMGYGAFAKAAAEAGVDGVLTVDLPPEEADQILQELKQYAIDPIFLLAPTTSDERVKKICRVASGYVYYVSVKGVTGAGHLNAEAVAEKIAHLRQLTDLPIGVGFGIKDGASARAVAQAADAVVVGSALIGKIELNREDHDTVVREVSALLASMRNAMDTENTNS
ncbi:MAG: tryptophan synthase subunit alpha [Gammaproteobacteria bacterium]|jgi:tryptophan synthase alpha chain|nr:tryptophan synthase subunit alpha [Gammaproteobacteria bacterium]